MAQVKAAVAFLCGRLTLAVVAVSTVLMILVFVVVEDNSTHLGFYSIVFNHNDDRVQPTAGSPPGGGLQSGDRVNLGALTPQQRFALYEGAHSGQTLDLQVLRNGTVIPVRVTASPIDYSERARLTRFVGTPLCFFLCLLLAATLFVMRPRAITLAFYIYTMLMLVKVNETALLLAAWPINVASEFAIQIVYPLAQLMILIFAQRLYGRPSKLWPRIFGTAVGLSLITFVVWSDPLLWIVYQRWGYPGPVTLIESACDALLLIVVLGGLAYIASGAANLSRSRVTWVVAGIALAPILDLTWALANFTSTLVGNASVPLLSLQDWTDALQPWFGLAGSAFVVYGFLSERVVDFRFVIGRAAAYGAVAAVLLLLFGVLEWWFEQVFESTRPAIYVSLFAALSIGLSLNALHGRIEDFLNAFFFREQRRAEEALRHAARALANTSSEKTLIEFLVDEPVRVLGLTSAALFLAPAAGQPFARTAERGWPRAHDESIDSEDPLIVELRAELEPIALDGRPRPNTTLPAGEKAPALVVPLMMRGTLIGFVFYGARQSGMPLTSDERSLLSEIGRSAAAAYDHIDADRSHARIAALEAQLRTLSS
jgi:hypothetical protein